MTKENYLYDIAVIGSGAAGTMAYLRSVLNYDATIIFTGTPKTAKRSRARWVTRVENMPGTHDIIRPITSNFLTTNQWIEDHPELSKKSTVKKEEIVSIQGAEGNFTLNSQNREKKQFTYRAKYIIVTTGMMDIQPEIDGSISPILPYANRSDVIYCIRCDGHLCINQDIAIIGHTDAALFCAQTLKERYELKNVSILTNGLDKDFGDEAVNLINESNFTLYESPIVKVMGNYLEEGLTGFLLQDKTEVKVTKAIISLGSIYYNSLLKKIGAKLNKQGRAIVSEKYESSVAGIFVAGDLVADKKAQIYTAWDQAVDAADSINKRLRTKKN